MTKVRGCSVPGCAGRHAGRGLCAVHYQRALRAGEIKAPPRPELRVTQELSAARLWAKCSPEPTSGCWLWTGTYTTDGYGRTKFGATKLALAHRRSWEITYGPIPAGLYVCHRCDNRGCVNPAHLFLGTHLDNMRDMIAKGRMRNPAWPRPKGCLPEESVRAIREAAARGVPYRELSDRYGVKRNTISAIVIRQTWRHIP